MRAKNYKGRCTKKQLSKCSDVARLYDNLQIAYADVLETDENVKTIMVNVPLQEKDIDRFTTDFLCEKQNGDYFVRECVQRKNLTLPRSINLLQLSQSYWQKRGITDWGIIVEKEVPNNEDK